MIRFGPLVPLLALIAAPIPAQGVTMNRAAQQRLGIVTAPLKAASRTPTATSFAHAVDAGPLLALDADIATAAASAAASQAEAQRARALAAADATVARKVAEAATALARGDAARLQLLRRRLSLEWGPGIATLSDRRRGTMIDALAAGRSALVRIDAGGIDAVHPGAVSIDLGPSGFVPVHIIGPARTADSRQAVVGWLGSVGTRAASLLAPGLTLPVQIVSGPAQHGAIVPAGAILRQSGKSWVYVLKGAQTFERRSLMATPDAGGNFLATALAPGTTIAIRGAAKLYSAEQAGKSGAEE